MFIIGNGRRDSYVIGGGRRDSYMISLSDSDYSQLRDLYRVRVNNAADALQLQRNLNPLQGEDGPDSMDSFSIR